MRSVTDRLTTDVLSSQDTEAVQGPSHSYQPVSAGKNEKNH